MVATPAVAGGAVYTGTADGVLHALDAATGHSRWTYQVGGVTAPPVVTGGTVYVLGGVGTLYALTTSGGFRWKFSPPAATVARFIVADEVVYAAGVPLQSAVAVAGNVVYAGDINGGLWALRPRPDPG